MTERETLDPFNLQETKNLRDKSVVEIYKALCTREYKVDIFPPKEVILARAKSLEKAVFDKLKNKASGRREDYTLAVPLLISLINEGEHVVKDGEETLKNSVLIQALFNRDRLPPGYRGRGSVPSFAQMRQRQTQGGALPPGPVSMEAWSAKMELIRREIMLGLAPEPTATTTATAGSTCTPVTASTTSSASPSPVIPSAPRTATSTTSSARHNATSSSNRSTAAKPRNIKRGTPANVLKQLQSLSLDNFDLSTGPSRQRQSQNQQEPGRRVIPGNANAAIIFPVVVPTPGNNSASVTVTSSGMENQPRKPRHFAMSVAEMINTQLSQRSRPAETTNSSDDNSDTFPTPIIMSTSSLAVEESQNPSDSDQDSVPNSQATAVISAPQPQTPANPSLNPTVSSTPENRVEHEGSLNLTTGHENLIPAAKRTEMSGGTVIRPPSTVDREIPTSTEAPPAPSFVTRMVSEYFRRNPPPVPVPRATITPVSRPPRAPGMIRFTPRNAPVQRANLTPRGFKTVLLHRRIVTADLMYKRPRITPPTSASNVSAPSLTPRLVLTQQTQKIGQAVTSNVVENSVPPQTAVVVEQHNTVPPIVRQYLAAISKPQKGPTTSFTTIPVEDVPSTSAQSSPADTPTVAAVNETPAPPLSETETTVIRPLEVESTTAGPEIPSPTAPKNNLEIFLEDTGDNLTPNGSNSTPDNVEQMQVDNGLLDEPLPPPPQLPIDMDTNDVEDDPESPNETNDDPDELDDNDAEENDDSSEAEANWREGSVSSMMEHLLNHDEGTRKDVKFLVGPEKVPISAHKHFLHLISRKLSALVYPPNEDDRTHITIHLERHTPQAFQKMLEYIYCRRVDNYGTALETMELLNLATEFELVDLSIQCVTALRRGIKDDNVFVILESAVRLGEERLKELCIQYVCNSKRNLLRRTAGFWDLSKESLDLIFKNDNLSVGEVEIFLAAIEWAKHRLQQDDGISLLSFAIKTENEEDVPENIRNKQKREQDAKFGEAIRNKLDTTLDLIRFPLLTLREYVDNVVKTFVLESKVAVFLYGYLTVPENLRDQNFPRTWSDSPRRIRHFGSNQTHEPESSSEELPFGNGEAGTSASNNPGTSTSTNVSGSATGDTADREPARKRIKLARSVISRIMESEDDEDDDESTTSTVERNPDIDMDEDDSNLMIGDELSNSSQPEPNSSQSEQVPSTSAQRPRQSSSTPYKKIPKPLLTSDEEEYISVNKLPNGRNLHTFEKQLRTTQELVRVFRGFPNDGPVQDPESEFPVVINTPVSLFPVDTPHLTDFHVKYLCSKKITSFKNFLTNLNIQSSILFFRKHAGGDLSTLWNSGVNVTLAVNGVKVLKIDHHSGTLVISRIKDAADAILTGLKAEGSPPIKHVFLEEVTISSLDKIPTSSLESLTLRKVMGIKDYKDFLRECKILQQFSCDNMGDQEIDFGLDIGLLTPEGSTIRKLALGKASLVCSKPDKKLENSSVEELYLDNCKFHNKFIEGISLIFPNLKKFKICRNTNLKMILSILEIESLEWIGVWELTLIKKKGKSKTQLPENEKILQILREAELEDKRNEKTFILEKEHATATGVDPPAWKWKGTKLANTTTDKFDTFTQLDYDQFGWSRFYTDYELFYTLQNKEKKKK